MGIMRCRGLAWSMPAIFGLAAVVVLLHSIAGGLLSGPPLSPSAWPDWFQSRTPAVATMAVVCVAAQALAWYLLAVTLAGFAARLLELSRIVVVLDLVTVAAVRRVLAASIGASVVAATISASPAGADSAVSGSAPVMVVIAADAPPPPTGAAGPVLRRLDDAPPPTTALGPAVKTSPPPPALPPVPTAAPSPAPARAVSPFTPSVAVVRPRGNLWQVAADSLAAA